MQNSDIDSALAACAKAPERGVQYEGSCELNRMLLIYLGSYKEILVGYHRRSYQVVISEEDFVKKKYNFAFSTEA